MNDHCSTYDFNYEKSLLISLLSQIESQNEYANVLLYIGHLVMSENKPHKMVVLVIGLREIRLDFNLFKGDNV